MQGLGRGNKILPSPKALHWGGVALGREALAALGAATGQHIAATDSCHARTETVPALSDKFRWLIGALHVDISDLPGL
jgi:hypothetical protein